MFFLIILYIQIVNCLHLPKFWHKVSTPFKLKARNWFIGRAETLGIPWTDLKESYMEPNVYNKLEYNKEELEDPTIQYPLYYTQPFHGYDNGNLNWLAAQEAEAATLNIAAGYWPDIDPIVAQSWLRNNITATTKSYMNSIPMTDLEFSKIWNYSNSYNILDVGCSIGYSTEFFQDLFPEANMYGLDLSPYFLSVAKYRSDINKRNISYIHENAEYFHSEEKFRIICCNFLFHEVPKNATLNILNNLYNMIETNGIIVIADIEPEVLKYDKNNLLTPFRKWMFEITEPHIFSYYENDMKTLLENVGFKTVEKKKNDPVNSVWVAIKK